MKARRDGRTLKEMSVDKFPDLARKVVVITGAAQGIGLAYVRGFAAVGSRVVAIDILDAPELPDGAIYRKTDVTDPTSLDGLVEETLHRYGQLDVLVNNAAVFGGLVRRPWDEIPVEEWERVLRVTSPGVGCAPALALAP